MFLPMSVYLFVNNITIKTNDDIFMQFYGTLHVIWD